MTSSAGSACSARRADTFVAATYRRHERASPSDSPRPPTNARLRPPEGSASSPVLRVLRGPLSNWMNAGSRSNDRLRAPPGEPRTRHSTADLWRTHVNPNGNDDHRRGQRPVALALPLLLTVEDAAARLGIGRTVMYALVKSGDVESIRIGHLRRIPVDALHAFVEALRTQNPGLAA